MAALILLRLTLQDVVTDIPHDLSAFLTYALLLAYVGFIYLGNRGTAAPPPGRAGEPSPGGPDPRHGTVERAATEHPAPAREEVGSR